jgi:hypothetical protein
MLFPAPASVPGTSNRSASHRAALLREHARALADQAAREGRQDRARYLADQAATFEPRPFSKRRRRGRYGPQSRWGPAALDGTGIDRAGAHRRPPDRVTRKTANGLSAFGGNADITVCGNPLSRSLLGAKRTCPFALHMSAFDPKRTCLDSVATMVSLRQSFLPAVLGSNTAGGKEAEISRR